MAEKGKITGEEITNRILDFFDGLDGDLRRMERPESFGIVCSVVNSFDLPDGRMVTGCRDFSAGHKGLMAAGIYDLLKRDKDVARLLHILMTNERHIIHSTINMGDGGKKN